MGLKVQRSVPTDGASASKASAHVDAKRATGIAAERLSDALLQAEDAIRALGLGVRASVVIEAGGDEDGQTWVRDLTFCKRKGRWGLVVETSTSKGTIHIATSEAQVVTTSVETRRAAAAALPKLVSALKLAHRESLSNLDALTARVRQFAKALPEQVHDDEFLESAAKSFESQE